ncbi:MAG: response regulator transcription factor [Bacteroidetes bacterium]|nr:response regulator transcription factor [Bacteroidota bacterium]
MKKISVLIADDHKMFREGIRSMLEKEKDIEVAGEAENLDGILQSMNEYQADVVLMDITMGETCGIEATKVVIDHYKDVAVLALSMHSDKKYILEILEAGAKGYILKNAGKEEMLNAIRSVARGDGYFSSEVSSKLIEHLSNQGASEKKGKSENEIPISDREKEVLRLIALDYSNPEIAEKLFISIRTVDTHKRNLLEKLGAKNTAGLVKYAMRKGIIGEEEN